MLLWQRSDASIGHASQQKQREAVDNSLAEGSQVRWENDQGLWCAGWRGRRANAPESVRVCVDERQINQQLHPSLMKNG